MSNTLASSLVQPWEIVWKLIAYTYEGEEWDNTYEDAGNWSGGAIGVGELLGSKFGISGASFPSADIKNLTFEAAGVLFKQHYWDKVLCDNWPIGLGLCVVDSEYNNGPALAPKLLQQAAGLIGADVDGLIGPQTIAAVNSKISRVGINAMCAEFNARRMDAMGGSGQWATFGLGWSRRLARLPFDSIAVTQEFTKVGAGANGTT